MLGAVQGMLQLTILLQGSRSVFKKLWVVLIEEKVLEIISKNEQLDLKFYV